MAHDLNSAVSPNSSPKVSVAMITYDHEKFIAQAIESVLMQKTDFDFEIVVGEDCSTDNTREVVMSLALRNPRIIRLLPSSQNLGMIKNFTDTFRACRGEYIALLEGDDYWTSARKLQNQVDYLDANPDCSECCHRAILVGDLGREVSRENPRRLIKPKYSLKDLLLGDFYPWTCTVMLRRKSLAEFPRWYYRSPVGDFPLHALMAEHGDIGYLDEFMGAYRIHSEGIWSEGANPEQWFSGGDIKRLTTSLAVYELLHQHFRDSYGQLLRERISNVAYDLVWLYRCKRNWQTMRTMLFKAIWAKPWNPKVRLIFILKCFVIAHLPILDSVFRRYRYA